jgi:PTH1 family peptidyl-tRNA hydrolase
MPRLVVGLGNPGAEYARTRHNMGFLVVERLAERWRAEFKRSGFFQGRVADARTGLAGEAERVRLVEPYTYMNLCGPVYARALEVHEVEAKDALVVVDDFMLPFGRLRLRPDGSPGGHNGLKSIEASLGNAAYPRLRIGVGPVPPGRDPADYVLGGYSADERRGLGDVVDAAADAVVTWLEKGMDRAMERHNRAPEEPA